MKQRLMEWESELMQDITCKYLILKMDILYRENNKFKFNRNHNISLLLITNLLRLFKKSKRNRINF